MATLNQNMDDTTLTMDDTVDDESIRSLDLDTSFSSDGVISSGDEIVSYLHM
tara:strand:+ start:2166 stop:2321 length:156 start_codon:yes stop_codon:yes gene_type:complete